jgi:hypothetical protein
MMLMTDDQLVEIEKKLAERDNPGRTHWEGCHLDPQHRDCLAYLLLAELKEIREELKEREQAFDRRWAADQRGIKRWQEATGKTMEWPDQAELIEWLLHQLDQPASLKSLGSQVKDDIPLSIDLDDYPLF